MEAYNKDEILAAVRADYEARPASAQACQLGELMIAKPDQLLKNRTVLS